jgi:indolepyruvate ferredoxin oxidoreductase beta subunit
VDGVGEATRLGNARVVNVILLGVLSTRLPFPGATWDEALKKHVKPKHLDVNLKAFARGRELGKT